eukprot:Rhum_TRINITY_DN14636_c1_g1::Rhum_TRINITY_DN14636_c1_g1_i1::g.104642::m.104642
MPCSSAFSLAHPASGSIGSGAEIACGGGMVTCDPCVREGAAAGTAAAGAVCGAAGAAGAAAGGAGAALGTAGGGAWGAAAGGGGAVVAGGAGAGGAGAAALAAGGGGGAAFAGEGGAGGATGVPGAGDGGGGTAGAAGAGGAGAAAFAGGGGGGAPRKGRGHDVRRAVQGVCDQQEGHPRAVHRAAGVRAGVLLLAVQTRQAGQDREHPQRPGGGESDAGRLHRQALLGVRRQGRRARRLDRRPVLDGRADVPLQQLPRRRRLHRRARRHRGRHHASRRADGPAAADPRRARAACGRVQHQLRWVGPRGPRQTRPCAARTGRTLPWVGQRQRRWRVGRARVAPVVHVAAPARAAPAASAAEHGGGSCAGRRRGSVRERACGQRRRASKPSREQYGKNADAVHDSLMKLA